MTTIAWRDGIMAADRLAVTGGMRADAKKLHRLPDGRVVGCAGSYRLAIKFVSALRRAAVVGLGRDFHGLVMLPNGKLLEYEDCETAMPVTDRFYAIGTGAHAAMAAMYCGKSAAEAVKIAGRVDNATGCGRVDVVYSRRALTK